MNSVTHAPNGRHCISSFIVGAGLLILVGCQEAPPENTAAAPEMEAAGPLAADPVDEKAAAFAKLSPEDRLLAEKQKVCPVGGPLGSMGVPYKIMVGDRPVFLCCEHCEKEVQSNPDKYLAKLDAAAEEEADEDAAAPPAADAGQQE